MSASHAPCNAWLGCVFTARWECALRRTFFASGFRWLMMVDFPELSRPTTRHFDCLLLPPPMMNGGGGEEEEVVVG